jgi:hypothetical protein
VGNKVISARNAAFAAEDSEAPGLGSNDSPWMGIKEPGHTAIGGNGGSKKADNRAVEVKNICTSRVVGCECVQQRHLCARVME